MFTEYALKNGRLVHVSEVERGLKCGCFCPNCNEQMIAHKGNQYSHHFAHQNAECSHVHETTLHLMAKEILEKEKRIMLPTVRANIGSQNQPSNSDIIYSPKIIEFDEVYLEKRYDDIVPDVLIRTGDNFLIIEIFVTNEVNETKRKKIIDSKTSALEINLSEFYKMPLIKELRTFLLEEKHNKKWIYNRVAEYYKILWLKNCDRKKELENQIVQSCPLENKKSANVVDDCFPCSHLVHEEKLENDWYLYCSGRTKITSITELKNFLKNNGGNKNDN